MAGSTFEFKTGLIVQGVLIALVAGTLTYWSRQPTFPIYGYVFDGCLILVIAFVAFRMRRWRAEMGDEFLVTKQRVATQIGFISGFTLYSVVNVLPFLFPDAYDAMFARLDGPREGFILGQAAGMAPFVVGLLFGHVVAWLKYR